MGGGAGRHSVTPAKPEQIQASPVYEDLAVIILKSAGMFLGVFLPSAFLRIAPLVMLSVVALGFLPQEPVFGVDESD